jgi:hypothetical protein
MGKAGGELLSLGGYDEIAIGNNEGFEVVETRANLANVNFLSCNLYKYTDILNETKVLAELNGVKKSIISEKAGIKSLTSGSCPFGSYNQFYILVNMNSTSAFKEIHRELCRWHRCNY